MSCRANLSEIYFTNRQDRYLLVRRTPQLADYFCTLVRAVGDGSFQLAGDQSLRPPLCGHPVKDRQRVFQARLQQRVVEALQLPPSVYRAIERVPSPATATAATTVEGPAGATPGTPVPPPERWATPARALPAQPFDECDTYIVPSVQMGPLGIHQDAMLTKRLLRAESGAMCLMSAYFNVTAEYTQAIMDSQASVDIISASPEVLDSQGGGGNMCLCVCM